MIRDLDPCVDLYNTLPLCSFVTTEQSSRGKVFGSNEIIENWKSIKRLPCAQSRCTSRQLRTYALSLLRSQFSKRKPLTFSSSPGSFREANHGPRLKASPPVPEGYSQGTKCGDDNAPTASRITPPAPSPNSRGPSQSTRSGFGTTAVKGGEYINRLVAKKSTKKPTAPPSRELPPTELRLPASEPKPASPSVSPVASIRGFDADIEMGGPMDMEVPIEQSPEVGRRKRKASVLDDELPAQRHTLGGGVPRESVFVREIVSRAKGGNQHGCYMHQTLCLQRLY
ncbi:hypothetical protein JVT61DRAFT_84 [Boletus reticuloceps]|uniref:Uncharacterized protein n=1 Tax=Boletus reticuloceps TaxID=495285 RepID=A0A8I2Z327_9AGAM|nr:hypothetical protein JVT61DRAFT_84 [Boletus reticuloceps]